MTLLDRRSILLGAATVGSTPAELAAFLRAETAKWAEVVKAANIRIE